MYITSHAGFRPSPSRALLPGRFLQLMRWLARRGSGATAEDPAERRAAAALMACMELPGAAALLRLAPADEKLEQRWAALAQAT